MLWAVLYFYDIIRILRCFIVRDSLVLMMEAEKYNLKEICEFCSE